MNAQATGRRGLRQIAAASALERRMTLMARGVDTGGMDAACSENQQNQDPINLTSRPGAPVLQYAQNGCPLVRPSARQVAAGEAVSVGGH